jgi:hypothetical protein
MDEKLNKLREEAEKILNQSISQKDDIPLSEFNRIIHDLKVYQIELEVQNEELRNTQKLLEDSRNQYAQLYNDAPAGYVTLDENSIVLQANQTFANMINKDMRQIINFSFSEFIEYEDSNIFNSRFNAFFKKPEGKNMELKLYKKNGKSFYTRISGKLIYKHSIQNLELKQAKLFLIITDITVQKLAELELKNKELQNRKLSDELESILDHIPGLVFYKDNKNNFIRVNKYYADAHNKNKNELVNTNLADLYPAPVAEKYYQDDLSVINSGIAKLNIEEEWDTTEGLKWVSTSKIPFKNANEEIIGIIGISMDITNRRKADEKIRKLSQAVEQSPVSVVITNLDGNIEYVNPKFVSITGYTFEEVLGNNPRVLKSGEQSEDFYKELWVNITNGKVWKGEFRNKKKNGDFYWESASISPIKTDEGIVTHFIAVKEDITDRKLAEEEIKLKNEELQLLNATKDKFFSIIAHDLKSPFNSIIGFSEALVEQVKNADHSGIEKYAGIINQSSYRAMNLLTNLMEWAKSQTGRMEFNPESFKINDIISETIILFEEIAGQKLITIKAELPDNYTVSADKAMVSTILRNLISNAVKFTKQGGELCISTTLSKQKVIISVKDNGVGIPSENIEKLFRIDESYSTYGTNKEIGTGLGLILCKEFIDKHAEKIWVESELTIGTCFYFTLSSNTENEEKTMLQNEFSIEKTHIHSKGLKILIAEDDEISEKLITTLISKISSEILIAGTGKEAVEICRNNPDIDLILMDIKMPDINGYEASRQIRKFNKDVIIIAQSAFGLTGDREKAIEAGCNEYISKPIKKIILFEKIENYFKL